MADLTTTLGSLVLRNPLIGASGTVGYGPEMAEVQDLCWWGALSLKGTTLRPRDGNAPPRVVETPAGVLNAIGLQNVGVDALVAEKLPAMKDRGVPLIINIAGAREDEYVEVARRLDPEDLVAAIEVNVSCPNVSHGGMAFGSDPGCLERLVRAVRAVTRKHLMVKLTPNVTDIRETARAAEAAGADSVSLINTLLGMVIDVERRRPALANVTGGLSGPAVRPVAVRMVWDVSRAVRIPVVGMGGIMSGADAVQFLLAGARAVQLGTVNFVNPHAPREILDYLEDYLRRHGFTEVRELVGAAHGPAAAP